jgi:hypothetical protein
LPASRRFPGDASRHERPREDAIRSRLVPTHARSRAHEEADTSDADFQALLLFPWVRDAADRRWEAIDEPGSAESASNVPQYPV